MDAAEIVESFYDHADEVYKFYPMLRINQILNFKNDVDDIVGYELDELVYYITKVHSLSRPKARYTCRELFEDVLPKWAAYATKMRE